jgi:hypothetical protein
MDDIGGIARNESLEQQLRSGGNQNHVCIASEEWLYNPSLNE